MATENFLRSTSLLHNPEAISSHNCKLFPCFENNPDANFQCLSLGHTMRKICLADNFKTTGYNHSSHRAVCALCPSLPPAGNPLTCQKPWLAFIHGSHSGVCAHTCMHTRVCVCRFELTIRCLPQSLHLIFETLSFP